MEAPAIGFAMCGSFCTFQKAIPQMKELKKLNYELQIGRAHV